MIIQKFKGILIILTILCNCGDILASSVQFVRAINLEEKKGSKSVGSFFFGRSKKKSTAPVSLCRSGQNRLCITDSINGAVVIIEDNGEIKKRITRIKGLRLVSPVSACCDEQGNLYVSDSAMKVVLKFDPGYKFTAVFISRHESRITGIAFAKGFFYCVDTQNHQVLCFDHQGQLKFTFGKRGTGEGEFNFPTHITADNEYIYVTDAMNFRVQIFNHGGEVVRSFGTSGRGGGNFSKPKGIAVDSKKHIFVADAMFDNVQIFNFEGDFLSYFGGPGHQEKEFWMPNGIIVDNDNTIWVADTFNHRIQIFRLVEDVP